MIYASGGWLVRREAATVHAVGRSVGLEACRAGGSAPYSAIGDKAAGQPYSEPLRRSGRAPQAKKNSFLEVVPQG